MLKNTRLFSVIAVYLLSSLTCVANASHSPIIIENSLPPGATVHGSDVVANDGEWPWDRFESFGDMRVHGQRWSIAENQTGQHYLLGLNYVTKENDTLTTHLQIPSYCSFDGIQLQLNVNGNWNHRIHWGTRPSFTPSTQVAVDRTPDSAIWEWRNITVPLSDFGVVPGERINGIAFTRKGCIAKWAGTRIGGNTGNMGYLTPFLSAKHRSKWGNASAEKAIDGNTDGDFFNGSVTHTHSTGGNWWQGDLGVSKPISAIKIYPRTDCCEDRLQKFDIYILNNDLAVEGQYINISKVRDQAVARFTRTLEVPDGGMTWDLNESVNGRYVLIHKYGNSYLSLAEVEAYTDTSKLDDIADSVAQVYAKICPNPDDKCLYQVPLLQLMSVDSLDVEVHTNWLRSFLGLSTTDVGKDALCYTASGDRAPCFPNGAANTDTLFVGAEDLNNEDKRTFHYSWGIYEYKYQYELGEEKLHQELVLLEPQQKPEQQNELAVIHMNKFECLSEVDHLLKDPFSKVRNNNACRGKIHLGDEQVNHDRQRMITYKHQYTNLGELFYIKDSDSGVYRPYFSSVCAINFDKDELRAWLANPRQNKTISTQCVLADKVQQINTLLHQDLIGRVNANNIFAQSLWGFVGELGSVLSEATALNEAALLTEQGQNLRKVALTLQAVGLTADALINGLSIIDAQKDMKACRQRFPRDARRRRSCQEGPAETMLLSLMGLGADTASTVGFISDLNRRVPDLALQRGDIINPGELEPLLNSAKNKYRSYGATNNEPNPLSDKGALPKHTLNELPHVSDEVSARKSHLHEEPFLCK